MSTKETPTEVVTAIDLATQAQWPVSNRNGKYIITAPDGTALTIGHHPNSESLKNFRSTCRRYNLIGDGPARTPDEKKALEDEANRKGLEEAERLNQRRRNLEREEQAKRQQAIVAAEKAEAATAQGMIPSPEVPAMESQPGFVLPTFDPALLGTRDNTKFKLADNLYYCIECWGEGKQHFAKAPQGLAAHRGRFHRVYPGSPVPSQETSRVILPEDVSTAMDMLRSVVAEALAVGDPHQLTQKDAELEKMQLRLTELNAEVDRLVAQGDRDRADFDKRFLEAQVSADKAVDELKKDLAAKGEAESFALLQRVHTVLGDIRVAIDNSTPAQAVGKVDEIISTYLS